MSAHFITFEGGEGTGKSTQCRLLAERLRAAGIATDVTREPGGTAFAERLRDLILSDALPTRVPLSEALLFLAARADHVATRIRPALARGTWIVCDRFSDSTLAYQGLVGSVPTATLRALDALIVGDTRPHLTLILDLPASEGLARARQRRGTAAAPADDPYEARSIAFHDRLGEAFREIAAAEPERCALIDARGTPEEVAARAWAIVSSRLLPGAH